MLNCLVPDSKVGYRWWTIGGGRDYGGWWLKAGPVTIQVYQWFDGRWRVGVVPLHQREYIVWGGPL